MARYSFKLDALDISTEGDSLSGKFSILSVDSFPIIDDHDDYAAYKAPDSFYLQCPSNGFSSSPEMRILLLEKQIEGYMDI